jgi:OmpA-OmpF porin, OOP family
VTLPKNFTLEAEVLFRQHGTCMNWSFPKKDGDDAIFIRTAVNYDHLSLTIRVAGEQVADDQFEMKWDKPHQFALWVQDGRLRLYADGKRLADVNQLDIPDMGAPHFDTDASPDPQAPDRQIGFRVVRFAESAPDFGRVIMSKGRYVTHGIHFDTDSDVLKAESAPVIKSIARALTANPDLSLQIEGHTDSVGVAAHNLDLSKRRAEAVRTALATQFGVDGGRLTCAGLGSTKPIAPNRTEAGRAQNRRVEFVRK